MASRLKQRAGETQDEYETRRAELAAKNKSGKSTANWRSTVVWVATSS